MPSNIRHYRVAQKEIQEDPKYKNGIFIEKDEAKKILLFSSLIVLLVFIKGLIIGSFLKRD
ncbi:MAG: hypothetical protein ACK5LT_06875 [Lachnospirales bacterium]